MKAKRLYSVFSPGKANSLLPALLVLSNLTLLGCGGGDEKGKSTSSDSNSVSLLSSSSMGIPSSSVAGVSSVNSSSASTASSQPPVDYFAQFANVLISPVDNQRQRIQFLMKSETIAETLLLSCRWNPDVSNTTANSIVFPCKTRTDVNTEFEAKAAGSFTGELSVTLPNNEVVKSNYTYSVSKSNTDDLVSVSSQFGAETNENFYVFQSTAEPQVLRYLPKNLALSNQPGIASVQRVNKVTPLLQVFLKLSDTDWMSANQLIFSSRFTLNVDIQKLRQESESAGFTSIADLKIKPPLMMLEQRYTTSVPLSRIQIQCKQLTLLIDGNSVTLHDCNLSDSSGTIPSQAINYIGGLRYESLNFDPQTLTDNRSLRGTFNIEYTLPGTREFDRLLSTNNGDLQSMWQLHFSWPLMQTEVISSTLTFNWQTLLSSLNTQVSAGLTRWDGDQITAFISAAISNGAITSSEANSPTAALRLSISNFIKQELFVAIYAEQGSSPLFWVPKLRFKNSDQINTQQVVLRYFDSTIPLHSRINLSCLAKPDEQNNVYKSPACGGG